MFAYVPFTFYDEKLSNKGLQQKQSAFRGETLLQKYKKVQLNTDHRKVAGINIGYREIGHFQIIKSGRIGPVAVSEHFI